MFYRTIIITVVFLYVTIESKAQSVGHIYIEDSTTAKFDEGPMERDINSDYSFFQFLGYQTLWHNLLKDTTIETINREGIVLAAKSTFTSSLHARAAFAKNNDSCIIDYEAQIDKIRNGRSATLSIMNLLSKRSGKVRQPEPDTTLNHVRSHGTISLQNENDPFSYSLSYRNKMIPNGWLVLHGDTLFCKPVTKQYKRKGKLIKAPYYFLTGFTLMKNSTIYAAIDQCNPPDIAYISNHLTEPERLVIAAYLFIVACYQ